jgi:type II secretory pathway predicted ATPase ExeA
VELFFQIQNAITDLYDKRRITPVFILDEMQSASAQFLHDLSIIFNFDMDKRNPFILILTGLPTLANRLALNQNRSLDQRLVTRFHFSPLTPDEVRDYIKHRFKHAGVSRNLINENAYEAISSSTGGYPRLVGNLVTQCLILAFQKQRDLIDEEIVFAASAEAGI